MPNTYPSSIRLPPKLRQLLRKEAKHEGRSFGRHVEYILTRWFMERGISLDSDKIQEQRRKAKEETTDEEKPDVVEQ